MAHTDAMHSKPTASPMAGEHDLQDAQSVIDLFERAADASFAEPGRRGAVTDLPDHGLVVMTGDLHDHALNLRRIVKLARLDQQPDHHVVLHEVIHGPARINGMDLSIRTLARVAALKTQFPEQVHLLQANHELAQLAGEGILKEGVSVVEAFDAGIDFLFHDRADEVREAMNRLLRSLLLAVRCPHGVMCCHSLPAPRHIERFDKSLLDRVPGEADLSPTGGLLGRGGDAYRMVWGRHHTQKVADELARAWGATLFVLGHQPAEMGWKEQGKTMLILASDHNHGAALPIDLGRPYTRDELLERVVLLAGVSTAS